MASFNNPVRRKLQPTYGEGSKLRSSRDKDANSLLWKKTANGTTQGDVYGRAIYQINRVIETMRRRIISPIIPAPQPAPFYPFKIYQPNNVASFVGQMAPMFTDNSVGAPTQCLLVNSQTPTNLLAMPPQVSVADTWRFFSIRSGLCEFRPIYNYIGFDNFTSFAPFDSNNWGSKFGGFGINSSPDFITGTDGIGVWLTVNTFDQQTEATLQPPCVIGIAPDTIHQVYCSVWIQITADTVSTIYPNMVIYGIANNTDNVLGNRTFTSGTTVIPIGEVTWDAALTIFTPYQEVFDHINNRYPPGTGNFIPASTFTSTPAQGAILNFRGTFGYNDPSAPTINPADLTSQIFYPGDLIAFTDLTDGDVFNGGFVWFMFQHGYPAFFNNTINGPAFDSNWAQISPSLALATI